MSETMEYAGYTLKRGCGCRHGFCGACATIYRIKGQNELKTCLACQTQVQEGMVIATMPFFPLIKQVYDIETVTPSQQLMMQLYQQELKQRLGGMQRLQLQTRRLNP